MNHSEIGFFLHEMLFDCLFTGPTYSDQHAAIKSRMLKMPDGLWNCADSGYITSYHTTMWKHVEAKHMAQPVTCVHCGKMCPSKNALASHVSRYHRTEKNNFSLVKQPYI